MSSEDDPAILDGLPRDFPHDLAPGKQPPEVIAVYEKQNSQTIARPQAEETPGHAASSNQPAASPAQKDQLLPSPTSTAVSETSREDKPVANAPTAARSDAPPPPPPEVVMKPLPAAPEPVTAPEDVENPVDLVAREHALPPRAAKTASELDDPAVKDLGWRTDTVRPPSLIKGMSNDDVFMLIRRFNKVRLLLCSSCASTDSLVANSTRARDSSPSSRLPRSRDIRR